MERWFRSTPRQSSGSCRCRLWRGISDGPYSAPELGRWGRRDEPLATGVYLNGILNVSGTNATSSLSINLFIPGPGTFDLGPNNPNSGVTNWVDPTGIYRSQSLGGSGTIRVTAASLTRITGTFEFVANDVPSGGGQTKRVNITGGVFDITNP